MGWFSNAMKDLAGRKGAAKLKTTVKRTTEEGTVSVTVKGTVAVTVDELEDAARHAGVTVSGKGGTFQAGEGTQSGVLTGEDASEFAALVCDPHSFEETQKPKKRSGKADTLTAAEIEKKTAEVNKKLHEIANEGTNGEYTA